MEQVTASVEIGRKNFESSLPGTNSLQKDNDDAHHHRFNHPHPNVSKHFWLVISCCALLCIPN